MASKKLKFILTSGSVATGGFFAGKYYEKNSQPERLVTQDSIFGPALSHSESEKSPLEWAKSFSKCVIKHISNLTSTKAASPLPATDTSSRISHIMKYGFPGLDNVISYTDYVLSYDRRNRVAHWVFEHLTPESVKGNDAVDRSKCNFAEDKHIHPYFRSNNSDYKGSGYDRGHLAAAGNHKSSQHCIEETFYLSNMAPQVGKGFNRDSWNRLEKYVRKLTRVYPNVYCCTGPLYLPRKETNGKMFVKYEVIGANHVAVPTHFYKIVVGESKDGNLDMECYVMENTIIDDNIPLTNFQVPIDTVEKAAGLIFFDNLSKNRFSKINGRKP